jgi:hypothetical protein
MPHHFIAQHAKPGEGEAEAFPRFPSEQVDFEWSVDRLPWKRGYLPRQVNDLAKPFGDDAWELGDAKGEADYREHEYDFQRDRRRHAGGFGQDSWELRERSRALDQFAGQFRQRSRQFRWCAGPLQRQRQGKRPVGPKP